VNSVLVFGSLHGEYVVASKATISIPRRTVRHSATCHKIQSQCDSEQWQLSSYQRWNLAVVSSLSCHRVAVGSKKVYKYRYKVKHAGLFCCLV